MSNGRTRTNAGPGPFRGSASERFRFYTLLGFLILCLLGGGASRADVLSLVYLRPAAIICLVALLLSPGTWELRRFRILFVLLGLFAATMLVQLVPLPPEIWLRLPGHDRLAEAAAAAGFAEPWRPISLAPDLTLNSLLALLPGLVILVGFAAIREDQRQALLPVLIGFVFADAVWSVIQFVGGANSAAYLYAITNFDAPVGFFSNRNHHALFLALGFPMLAIWIGMPARDARHERSRLWLAAAVGLSLIPMILVTGSRAGAVLGGIGLAVAYLIAPPFAIGRHGRGRLFLRAGAVLLPVLLILVTVFADRAISFNRAGDAHALESEVRLEALPVLSDMLKGFLPEGTGYGAFDPAFRIYEPDSLLSPSYLNHAHNDLIELPLTGGAPALAILIFFLAVCIRQSMRAFARGARPSQSIKLARLGAILILLMLGASIVDYPLRVPLMSAVLAIACAWLTLPKPVPAEAIGEGGPGADIAAPRSQAGMRWAFRILVIILAAGLSWIALGVTASLVLGRLQPALVLAWWPVGAEAKATAASQALESQRRPTPQALTEAQALAWEALRREPVNVVAARTLGLIAALRGNQTQAERIVRYAESLSRRDLGIQFWLIESSVQRNDIAGALHHYDRALRTSPAAGQILYPVLVQASADRGVTRPLAALIARRPPWWRDFTVRLIAEGPSPAGIEAIIGAIRLDPQDADGRVLLVAALNRLVETGNYQRAYNLYRRALRIERAPPLFVRNGGFESENLLPPIDWMLSDREGLSAIVQPRPSGADGRALFLIAQNGLGGEVARQLLMLPPGAYRLTGQVGGVTGAGADRPQILLSCGQSGDALLDLRFPASPASGVAIGQDFGVPARCPFQSLRIEARSGLDEDASSPWIDDIAIQPRP